MFKYVDGGFENIQDGRRLDVQGGRDQEGNNVQVYKKNGTPAQKWKIVYQDEAEKTRTKGMNKDFGFEINRPFYLVSKMIMKRVMTCHGAHHVRLNTAHPNRSNRGQHWTFDEVTKTIKNVQWPNRSLTISGNNVIAQPTSSRWFQLWENKGDGFIYNERGRVLDSAGRRDRENNNIIAHKKHGGLNQQWEVVYVDQMKPEPKEGELNEQFNLIVGKPFYVQSGLASGRYLDKLGRNMVIKTPNGRNSQLWFFDQKSRTIKSVQHRGWSWDIHGAGRHSNMQAWNTNSGWW
jgi:hypothetical protein